MVVWWQKRATEKSEFATRISWWQMPGVHVIGDTKLLITTDHTNNLTKK